jgi:hypothetical protein
VTTIEQRSSWSSMRLPTWLSTLCPPPTPKIPIPGLPRIISGGIAVAQKTYDAPGRFWGWAVGIMCWKLSVLFGRGLVDWRAGFSTLEVRQATRPYSVRPLNPARQSTSPRPNRTLNFHIEVLEPFQFQGFPASKTSRRIICFLRYSNAS